MKTEKKEHHNKNVIKKTLIEWCKDSTSHGLFNIMKAQNIAIRLIWIICFLCSSGVCCYMIAQTISSYLSNPVSTTISVIDELPATFPTVTMCFLSPLAPDENVYAEIEKLMSNQTNYTDRSLSLNQITSSRRISYYLYNLNDSEKKAFGNTVENSLYICKFNSKLCDKNDLEWYFDFTMGNCYKFNSNGSLKVGKSGYLPSLQLQFVIGDSTSRNDYFIESGMRILIHNSSITEPTVFENGISLAPGFNYDLKLSRTYYTRLAAPYSECLKDLGKSNTHRTRVMNVMFDTFNLTTYSKQYCENLEFQFELEKRCECVSPWYPFANLSVPRCINQTQFLCQTDVFKIVYENPDSFLKDQCPKGFFILFFYFIMSHIIIMT